MSKWNKKQKQVSDEFLQNQQRRKKMILQAARRRKQKDKKLKQQAQTMQKQAEEALKKHRKSKQQEYVKYLRNNLHDKYKTKKQEENANEPQIKTMGKWKRKQKQDLLTGLDLEIETHKQTKVVKIHPEKQRIINQFQQQWKDQQEQIQEMIGSQLLDSLDLDFNTLARGKQYNKSLKMHHQIQQTKKIEKDPITTQLRQLIGYDSVLISIDQRNMNNITKNQMKSEFQQKKNIQKKIKRQSPPKNQGQAFNMLKNKKQGKILNWAIQEAEEADDLFSNCSSKRKIGTQPIKQNDISKQRANHSKSKLEPIPEKKETSVERIKKYQQSRRSKQKIKPKPQRSIEKNKTIEQPKINKQDSKNIVRIRNATKSGGSNRSLSKQKPKQPENKKNQTHDYLPNIKKTVPQFPPVPHHQPEYSIATHQQQFQVESFIRNDLINLNEQQLRLQNQIKNIHLQSKDQIKQIIQKHNIKIDYKTSKQLINREINNDSQVSYTKLHQKLTQDEIEESLQNLDNYLIRKDLQTRGKNNTINQEIESNSSKSIINPLSNPFDFQKQILQLAENISRLHNVDQNKEPQAGGYAYKNKMKKQPQKYHNATQSQEKLRAPPQFEYAKPRQEQTHYHQQQQIQSKYYQQEQQAPQERIKVNQRLKNLLLDDDQ